MSERRFFYQVKFFENEDLSKQRFSKQLTRVDIFGIWGQYMNFVSNIKPFSAIFQQIPIISDDFWRLPKISEDCRKWLSPIKYEIFTNLKKTETELKISGIIETSAFEDVQKGEALGKENVLEVFKTLKSSLCFKFVI